MWIEMQTVITSKVNVETMDVEHAVTIKAGEVSVLGQQGVLALALGGVKTALGALESKDTTITREDTE